MRIIGAIFLGYESSDKANVYHAKVAKQRHLRGLIVVEPTEGAAMMLQELNDYKRKYVCMVLWCTSAKVLQRRTWKSLAQQLHI